MEKYLESLNPHQREAVMAIQGPVLIVAGAGAGKTKTLTHRILHLIKNGIPRDEILAITFTNKAAKEMKERVKTLLSEERDLNLPISIQPTEENWPWVGTFHSLGVKILRENYRSVPIEASFSIYDRGESVKTIKEAMKRKGVDPKSFEPGKILGAISREKGNMLTVETFNDKVEKNYFRQLISEIWFEYEKILREEKSLDFDDLLLLPALLLKKDAVIREKYQNKWKYIHVDEYQDTNMVQYEMTKLLATNHKNICVVGDIDQNIYSWRGADIKNILNFEKDYPEAKIFVLEENYRSTQTILAVANKIIKKNKIRVEKNLFTKNTAGERIGLYTAYDEADEAHFVAGKTSELISAGVKPSEIAVLYRANFQSRALEEAFLSKNLPYQVLGVKFFERKEIKDAVAYLKASLNKDSFGEWKRIITAPPRGIGKVTLAKVANGQIEKLSPVAKKSVDELKKILSDIEKMANKEKLSETMRFIVINSGLIGSLKGSAEGEEKIENLKELITFAGKYDGEEPRKAVEHFLTDIALMSDQDEMEEKKEATRLMTVHASKGLEFNIVFITGLEEDLFPHKKINEEYSTDNESEEERRLFYVALTRAKKKIYLSYAGVRTIFGAKQVNIPSEFIFDIDDEFIAPEEPVQGGGKVIYLD